MKIKKNICALGLLLANLNAWGAYNPTKDRQERQTRLKRAQELISQETEEMFWKNKTTYSANRFIALHPDMFTPEDQQAALSSLTDKEKQALTSVKKTDNSIISGNEAETLSKFIARSYGERHPEVIDPVIKAVTEFQERILLIEKIIPHFKEIAKEKIKHLDADKPALITALNIVIEQLEARAKALKEKEEEFIRQGRNPQYPYGMPS